METVAERCRLDEQIFEKLGSATSLVEATEGQPGLFCDGTHRYGVPAPFFPSKEKNYL